MVASQIQVAACVGFSMDKQVELGLGVHWDPPRICEIETYEWFSLETNRQSSAGWSTTPWSG
jgi:hypothetical protein